MKSIDLKVYGAAPNGELLVGANEVHSGVQSIIDENTQLKQRNAELAAQIELLREAVKGVKRIKDNAALKTSYAAWRKLNEALEATPAQCLAEVKAQASASAIRSALRTFGNADLSEDEIKRLANEYANQIRQQAKAGE